MQPICLLCANLTFDQLTWLCGTLTCKLKSIAYLKRMCNCYQQYLLFCLRITSPLVLNLVRSHHLLYSLSQFCTDIGVSGCR